MATPANYHHNHQSHEGKEYRSCDRGNEWYARLLLNDPGYGLIWGKVRKTAVTMVGETGGRQAVPAPTRSLGDEDRQVMPGNGTCITEIWCSYDVHAPEIMQANAHEKPLLQDLPLS